MKPRTWLWIIPVVAAAGFAFVFARQREEAVRIAAQLETAKTQVRELQAANAEQLRLKTEVPTPEQLAVLRGDHDALLRLRAELSAIRSTPAAAVAKPAAAPLELPREANAWRDVGAATPVDALQTSLCALALGDRAAFARQLTFEASEREAVGRLFAQLPAEVRALYGTVEEWVAATAARGAPPSSARLVNRTQTRPDEAELRVDIHFDQLPGGAWRTKTVQFDLRRTDSRWQIVVPLETVQLYVRQAAEPK